MDVITSRHNAKIKVIRELKKRAARDERRLAFIEGRRLVEEALNVPVAHGRYRSVAVKMLCASESYAGGAGFGEIEAAARKLDLDILIASDEVFAGISETQHPQGLLSVIEMLDYTEEEVLRGGGGMQGDGGAHGGGSVQGNGGAHGGGGTRSKLLVLDHVADPGNVGVMLRTAEAAAFTGVVLSSGCADIYEPKTLRATMGSVFRIPFIRGADLNAWVDKLCDRGFQILASAAAGAAETSDCFRAHISEGDVALVIGSEASGVSGHILGQCDAVLSIPMPGGAESLNAGVAAGILMYEILRRESRSTSPQVSVSV